MSTVFNRLKTELGLVGGWDIALSEWEFAAALGQIGRRALWVFVKERTRWKLRGWLPRTGSSLAFGAYQDFLGSVLPWYSVAVREGLVQVPDLTKTLLGIFPPSFPRILSSFANTTIFLSSPLHPFPQKLLLPAFFFFRVNLHSPLKLELKSF